MKLKTVELTHTLTNIMGGMPVAYLMDKDWEMNMDEDKWYFTIKRRFGSEDTLNINKTVIKSFSVLPEEKADKSKK